VNGSIRVRGAGVVCALGVGAASVAAAVSRGDEFSSFRGPSTSRAAYPVPFDAQRDLPRGLGRRLGRQLAMSLAAVFDAVGPGSSWDDDPADTGIVGGTAHGPVDETAAFVSGVRRDGPRYASPLLFSAALHNSMASIAAKELGIRGPAMVMSNGDVSFETALLVASAGLSSGRMTRAIVVGADAFHPLHARTLAEFDLVSDSPRPVDPAMRRTTAGIHLGEGAGALLLEWHEDGDGPGGGVRVDDVRLGSEAIRRGFPPARVQVLATGDTASARRHSRALAVCEMDGAETAYPAARFGAFPSLSAVAIAVECARRLRSHSEPAPTLFVAVPHRTNAASVLVSGCGGA
jgi:3-oxoacyl-(acyl-carrier-protein) synthase